MNQDQFIALLLQHQDRIFAFVSVLLPRHSDAEDVSQQTCLILWQKREDFDPDRDFMAWARGIARNQVRLHYRSYARERVSLSDAILDQLADAAAETAGHFSERRDAAVACLDELRPEQQALLRDCYQSGDSIKDVADACQTTAAALYMKLRRLRLILVKCVRRRLAALDH